MKERHLKYNTPKRQIKRIETANLPGGMGAVNRLSSGVGLGGGNAFGDLIVRHNPINSLFSNIVLMDITENETKAGQGYL